MADNKLVIVLEEKPEKDLTPLADLQALIDAKEYGDRRARPGKSPVPTALVRCAVKAYATNIKRIREARALAGDADGNYPELVARGLDLLIKARRFARQKQTGEQSAAAAPTTGKGGNRRTRHTTRGKA